MSITPTTASVNAGATQTLTASVTNGRSGNVTWTSTGGALTSSGLSATWTAPSAAGSYSVTATSADDATKSASATLTVNAVGVTMNPATVTVASGATRTFTATVSGSSNTELRWMASNGTLSATSGATVSWTAQPTGGAATITATSVADPTRSATATVTVTPVVISLAAQSATVPTGGTTALTATVSGSADSSVTWQTTGGTIVGSGRTTTWQAPSRSGSYVVRAISALDATRRDSVSLAVTPIALTIASSTTTPFRGQPVTLTATVTGAAAAYDSVSWASTCGNGTTTHQRFVVNAPAEAGNCTVTATSRSDTSRRTTTTLSVRPDLVVNNTGDTNDGTCTWTHCTLREALTVASQAIDADTIRLGITAAPLTGTITLTATLPTIATPMAIIGPGAAQLTIDAGATNGAQRRVFDVNSAGAVLISGVTLRGGISDEGAGMRIRGATSNVTLNDAVIRNNTALFIGGGGVAVRSGATLTATNCIVTENRSETPTTIGGGGMGAIEGATIIVRGGSITNNVATIGGAGGIGTEGGTIRLSNVTITGNRSAFGGGGIAAWSRSTLEVEGGVVSNNIGTGTSSVGGGILIGAGTTTLSERATVTINGTTLENNEAFSQGGGIQVTRNTTISMSNLRVIGNRLLSTVPSAGSGTVGAGIYIGSLVTSTLTNSVVSDNVVPTGASGSEDGGGGIAVAGFAAAGSLAISNSTISGNSASSGGGIFVTNFGTVTLSNSTVSGNTASIGAGVATRRAVTISNSTIVNNRATSVGGGLHSSDQGMARISNTILASNLVNAAPSNCTAQGLGQFVSEGYNLGNDATCLWMTQTGDKANTASGLNATLANNGGPTLTHALLTGSAAINAGNPATCTTTDQRGAPRVGTCDIGAFEFGGVPRTVPVRASQVIKR
ncbi:MAG: hypothetical protein IBJ03_02605 [Gemmatimonadaceae bacterium]|nr:hypothetical protein [Gemmatimonadaceae bacterium]